MHECYAMQILEKQKKQNHNQGSMITKGRAMKHKDHVRRTQLDWAFYIQNFLDVPQALEFLFTWEWLPTPRMITNSKIGIKV